MGRMEPGREPSLSDSKRNHYRYFLHFVPVEGGLG
jgi:hypothetical protein